MAAKVVMVAVPTVLGIASIRVYTVREAPADGLVKREKLNIYTPLPQSAQVQIVPEQPGVIESRLTTARERILPFVQAVKGACISLKTGSVNLYYAGEDVYYYLKDPPPGFLPRFGTITMAGLLGMVLARKGSRFKQLAVPLGLMGAGASVCYPVQAVAVLKVTGKNVYAVGQWSKAALSSLLTSKPQEAVDKATTASQPQSGTVPNPEFAVVKETESSSTQSTTIPESELESAKSVRLSDEHVAAVITEEASSATLTDISPQQAPTEMNTDSVLHSVQSETETTTAFVESEKHSDIKQAPEEVSPGDSPAGPTLSFEPEADASAPADSEEPPVPRALDKPAVVESAEPEPASQSPVAAVEESPAPDQPAAENRKVVESAEPEPASQSPVAAVEESPAPDQPAAENRKGGASFKPDPSLMDFGQSSPEDEDLYSTRS